jgi:hypothetical protein
VSQTEGAELPAMREMSGEVGENRARLISFINRQNIELVFTENIAPALGMSSGGKIAILPGQSEAEEFSTLMHELAHEMFEHAKPFFAYVCKIKFNKKNELEIENYGQKPFRLVNVYLLK